MKLVIPSANPNWSDCHQGKAGAHITTAKQAYEAAFQAMPGWVETAMKLRNRLVAPLGLETSMANNGEMQPTSNMAMMTRLPVVQETSRRYAVGLSDKHLTFTLTTELEADIVSVTTNIWFNNFLGRIYLAIVLIPHKIIVRNALKALA